MRYPTSKMLVDAIVIGCRVRVRGTGTRMGTGMGTGRPQRCWWMELLFLFVDLWILPGQLILATFVVGSAHEW